MKFKKLITLTIVIVLICNVTIVNASANNEPCFNSQDYIWNTINFDEQVNTYNSNDSLSSNSTSTDTITAAIEFVNSLNLDAFPEVKASCLNQLYQYKQDNVQLASYSVLTPKARSNSYPYYGTYNGVDFYYNYYSNSSYRVEPNNNVSASENSALLQLFIRGGANFILSKVGIPAVTFTYSTLCKLLGLRVQEFTVTSNTIFTTGIFVKSTTRGIYGKDFYGNMVEVYSSEQGQCRPYLDYWFDDISGDSAGEKPFLAPASSVESKNYNNKNYILDVAYKNYNYGLNEHDYVTDVVKEHWGAYFKAT